MNASRKHMPNGGSVIALSYLAGKLWRWPPNYKVMGVAKAALEAYVSWPWTWVPRGSV